MLRLVYSNRSEALADELAERLQARRLAGVSALEAIDIVVPNRNLERYLHFALAERLGVSANLRFHRLERFVATVLLGDRRELIDGFLDRRGFEDGVLRVLGEKASALPSALGPVLRYVGADEQGAGGADLRRVQFAQRLGRVFENYAYSRPEFLEAWRQGRPALGDDVSAEWGDLERWQRVLWGAMQSGAEQRTLAEALVQAGRRAPGKPLSLPAEVHVFGLSYVARVFHWAFASLGQQTDMQVYVLNPCMEFWEDVPSESELRARVRAEARFPKRASQRSDGEVGEELPQLSDGATVDDPPLLTYWGRPGREHVHLLNELTGADFDARFEVPEGDSVLRLLQRDILERHPPRQQPQWEKSDGSLRALSCPGVRREVEEVANAIWNAIEAEPSLRFNDIAVFVPPASRELYLPHIASVFDEAHRIPHHVVDLPLAGESRVVEAAMMLLNLPFGRFRRPEVLPLLMHPALRVPGANPGEVDRLEWMRLIERLGIFHGLDHGDHEGTYIEGDLLNWDQGVRRLVLGQWMDAPGTDGSVFAGSYHTEPAAEEHHAGALALLIRSLVEDVRFAREQQCSLEQWSRYFAALFRGYLQPFGAGRDGEKQEAELRRCLGAAVALGERNLGDGEHALVSYRVAAELLRAELDALGGARGEYLADGVVVSALSPMRAIPFRHIFALGLGEGIFPSSERRDPMDLRGVKRKVGDVSPAERDKYVFLEALLCARDGFVVSWVGRDALTGDVVQPSSVVRQLLDVAGQGYVKQSLVENFSLRRHEGEGCALPEALHEAHAVKLGESLREHLGRSPTAEDLRQLSTKPAVATALRLAPVPQDRRSGDDAPRRISLRNLRGFLETPMQAWAQAIVGVRREEDERALGVEDEPLRPDPLARAQALRHSFLGALEHFQRTGKPVDPKVLYQEQVAKFQAQGRWPIGELSRRLAAVDEAHLASWRRAFSHSLRPPYTMRRLRFGSGDDASASDEVREALRLEVEVRGEVQEVEIVGFTEALFDAGKASLVLLPKAAPTGIAFQRERLRHCLRGFFDHVMLTAAGVREPAPHRCLLFYGGEAAEDASLAFTALGQDAATRYLQQLCGELLSRPHDYFLPGEAVFREPTGFSSMTAGGLARNVEVVRRNWGQRRELVPGAAGYRALPPDEALEAVHQRFGLFFQLSGLAYYEG